VERMVNEAERNASTDKEKRDRIEAKNQADSLAYQAEKQIKDLGDKVPEADKTKIEGLVKSLREVIAKDDHEAIASQTEELKQALYALSSSVYQQGGGESASGAAPEEGTKDAASGDDDVIDADFTESK
jgi:molecular chaperone DnaK